ncbi:MAG: sialidase family protein [Pirellulaceae bacterium]
MNTRLKGDHRTSHNTVIGTRITRRSWLRAAAAWSAMTACWPRGQASTAGEGSGLSLVAFDVQADVALQKLDPNFCWFHPRVAALPGFGREGQPAVVMTLQQHLAADDHYSGLFYMRTDDLGKSWTGPIEVPELAWRKAPHDITIAVADVTPGWHAPTGKLIAIGSKILYTASGNFASLENLPRSYETSYATLDPKTNAWTPWRELAMPETDGKFRRIGCGCSQWHVQPDGTLLVPVQFQPVPGGDYQATVLHCRFDGLEMEYLRHGDELAIAGGRGFAEPSLAVFQGTYYLTLRNDARAYVTTSDDGLHFAPVKEWTFDDGQDLGSYNTQAHWLTHSDGLFLAYTRRGADNDHIARHRAPLFVAQVDPQSLQVIRRSEKALLPERGVMLGNFGAAAITQSESWVTDAEFISRLVDPLAGTAPHVRGADGTVWVGRVKWSKPNLSVK